MRADLSENFQPNVFASYTYDECLALLRAGHTIPDSWLEDAYRNDGRAQDQQELAKKIADDHTQVAKDIAATKAAHLTAFTAAMDGLPEQLDTLKDELSPLAAAAAQAKQAHVVAANKVRAKYGEIRNVVREYFPDEPAKDFDGNALPGQTYIPAFGGGVFIDGTRLDLW